MSALTFIDGDWHGGNPPLMGALSHETELKMPPGDDAKLDAATIEAFRDWIDAGALQAERSGGERDEP